MKNITVEELKARMDNGEALNIIDVREPAEYAEYNIGAKLIPLGKIAGMQLEDLEDLKNDELIIHCKKNRFLQKQYFQHMLKKTCLSNNNLKKCQMINYVGVSKSKNSFRMTSSEKCKKMF